MCEVEERCSIIASWKSSFFIEAVWNWLSFFKGDPATCFISVGWEVFLCALSISCCVNTGTVAHRSNFIKNISTDTVLKVHCSNGVCYALLVFPEQLLFTESQVTETAK